MSEPAPGLCSVAVGVSDCRTKWMSECTSRPPVHFAEVTCCFNIRWKKHLSASAGQPQSVGTYQLKFPWKEGFSTFKNRPASAAPSQRRLPPASVGCPRQAPASRSQSGLTNLSSPWKKDLVLLEWMSKWVNEWKFQWGWNDWLIEWVNERMRSEWLHDCVNERMK